MTNYAQKLRQMREAEEQSDSGMTRSDETKARLKDFDALIRQSEASGAGRGQVNPDINGKKKGGSIKSSASKRADGIAQRGKTRGTMVMCMGGKTK